jgi:hypothetical protein
MKDLSVSRRNLFVSLGLAPLALALPKVISEGIGSNPAPISQHLEYKKKRESYSKYFLSVLEHLPSEFLSHFDHIRDVDAVGRFNDGKTYYTLRLGMFNIGHGVVSFTARYNNDTVHPVIGASQGGLDLCNELVAETKYLYNIGEDWNELVKGLKKFPSQAKIDELRNDFFDPKKAKGAGRMGSFKLTDYLLG